MEFNKAEMDIIYNENLLDKTTNCSLDASNWLFIIGPARTGTTILTKLLNQHPGCNIGNESCIFSYAISFFKTSYCKISNHNIKTDDIMEHYRITNIRNNKKRFNLTDVRKFCEMYRDVMCDDEIIYFGDKAPNYIYHINDLANTFPNCKLLITKRNFLDTAASLASESWFIKNHKNKNIAQRALKVAFRHYMIINNIDFSQLNANWLIVNYDKVCLDPKNTYLKIFNFLEISENDYDWKMFQHHYGLNQYNWRERVPDLENIVNQASKNGINNYSAEEFKKELLKMGVDI